MPPRRGAKAKSSGMEPREVERGKLVVGVPHPRAGDAVRQIGETSDAASVVGAAAAAAV